MARGLIGGVVATLIAVLTAAAYVVATSSLEDKVRKDVKVRVVKAADLLAQNASLEGLSLLSRAEALASDPLIVQALGSDGNDPEKGELGFKKYRANQTSRDALPDVMALTDRKGTIIVLMSGDREVVKPVGDQYLKDGKPKYPALELALNAPIERLQRISEVWDYEQLGPMKAAVAPVVDFNLGEIVGAVIIAHSITAEGAQRQSELLGTDVAYFYGSRVHATSFGGGAGSDKRESLAKPLFEGGLAKQALESDNGFSDVKTVDLDGDEYVATALRLQHFSHRQLPETYPPVVAGALVTMSVSKALAPVGTVKLAILLVGGGAILLAMLAIFLTARRILGPLDDIEVGINEIINGNIDRTFRPAGSDLDGLANALNVMMARLLGRPEPGEEAYDDDGNIIQPGALAFETESMSPRDQEAVNLAREPEGAYFQRVFEEYKAAKQRLGERVDGVTYESFVAKLRLNEANLKAKYESSAVRFKVVEKDNKVTLKPVPIS